MVTAISFLAAELAMRVVLPVPVKRGVATKEAEKAGLYGWAVPANYGIYHAHPDTGEEWVDMTNSQGWKDVEHILKRPEGVYRIVVVGDSVTWGLVPRDDLYTRVVEEKLKDLGFSQVEVISMGVSGWATDQELELLIKEGLSYDPDLVVYQFSGNDITGNMYPSELAPETALEWQKIFKYELSDGELEKVELEPKPVQEKKDTWSVRVQKVLLKSALVYNLNQARHRMLIGASENPEDKYWWAKRINPEAIFYPYGIGEESEERRGAWRLFESLLIEMKDRANKGGAQFLVVSEEGERGKLEWSTKWNLVEDREGEFVIVWEGEEYPVNWSRINQELKRLAERQGVKVILPTQKYERYDHDPHPNAKGNRAMADDIVQFLVNWEEFRGGYERAANE